MTLTQRIALKILTAALSLAGGTAMANVVAVVSSKSPVTSLSRTEIADIFLGRVSRFPDGTIAVPIDLVEGAAVRDDFYESIAGKSPAQLKAYWSKIIFTGRGRPPRTAADSNELKRLLASNPAAIGYLDEKLVDASVRVLR